VKGGTEMSKWIRRGLEVIYWVVLIELMVIGVFFFNWPDLGKRELEILLVVVGLVNGGIVLFAGLKGGTENWKLRAAWFMVLLVSILVSIPQVFLFFFRLSASLGNVVMFLGSLVILLTWAGLLLMSTWNRDYLSVRGLILLAIYVPVMFGMGVVANWSDWEVARGFFDLGEWLWAIGFGGWLWQGAYYLQARKFRWGIAYGVLGGGLSLMIMVVLGLVVSRFFYETFQW